MKSRIIGTIFVLGLTIVMILNFTGCSSKYTTTVYERGPFDSSINKTQASVEQTLNIIHQDDLVNKTVFTEAYTLKNGDIKDLKDFALNVDTTYENEIFQVEGFEYKSQLEKDSFIYNIICDYTRIDYKELSQDAIIFFYGEDNVDENYNLIYDKYLAIFIENGFRLKE